MFIISGALGMVVLWLIAEVKALENTTGSVNGVQLSTEGRPAFLCRMR